MNRFRHIILILLVVPCLSLTAQTVKEQWKQHYRQELQDYKDSTHDAFLQYLQRYWRDYELQRGECYPLKPIPAIHEVVDTLPDSTDIQLPADATQSLHESRIDDTVSVSAYAHHDATFYSFDFYGNRLSAMMPSTLNQLSLGGTTEKAVAAFWRQLDACGTASYCVLMGDLRSDIGLDGYGFYLLVRQLSAVVFPDNERQAVFVVYMLNQLHYDVRIGRMNGTLIPLIATSSRLYDVPYATMNGRRYYAIGQPNRRTRLYTYDISFPQATTAIDMHLHRSPHIGILRDTQRPFVQHYEGKEIAVMVNRQMMDYYSARPQTELDVYASAAVEDYISKTLVRSLLPLIDGKGDIQAVATLLRYVQESFAYGSDTSQFGRERTLFADELFCYPASDCEDRVVLFAYLIRLLVGTDIVLAEFDDHVVAAVALGETVRGCHYRINGKKYIVADPTTFGARLGYLSPRYQSQRPQIINIQKT